jgi:hypothetical protein
MPYPFGEGEDHGFFQSFPSSALSTTEPLNTRHSGISPRDESVRKRTAGIFRSRLRWRAINYLNVMAEAAESDEASVSVSFWALD